MKPSGLHLIAKKFDLQTDDWSEDQWKAYLRSMGMWAMLKAPGLGRAKCKAICEWASVPYTYRGKGEWVTENWIGQNHQP